MLKKFEVSNFKSFKETTSFDLTANKNIDILKENCNEDILKGLLFVGPNASGKTNVISAIKALLEISYSKCNLARYVNIFNAGEMYLSYNFSFDNLDVYYKVCYNSKNKSTSEILKFNDTVAFEIENESKPTLNKYLEENKENEFVKTFSKYLKNSIFIDLYNSRQSESENSYKNPKIIYTDEVINELNEFLINCGFDFTIKKELDTCEKEDILFIREGTDICMPYEMESIGNKTVIYIFPIIKKVIDKGTMLLLDEFGTGMHNELEELLIRYFMKSSVNSQMFFVSHSTNLLSQNLLRADQIFSVDYENSSSIAYRFSEEMPRSTQNLEKMYLGGVFGGLPNYSKK